MGRCRRRRLLAGPASSRGGNLRILYISHAVRDERKGAAYADIRLLEGLRRLGHEVDEVWDIGAPRVIRHDNLHLLLEAPRKCEHVARNRAPHHDLVIANQPLAWRAARRLRRTGGPLFVARSHGWEPRVELEMRRYAPARRGPRALASRVLGVVMRRENERLLRWADAIVCGSSADKQFLENRGRYPAERIEVVPPGVPAEFFGPCTSPASGDRMRRILYVGQFAPVKAPEIAASVISGFLDESPHNEATWVCERVHHALVLSLLPERQQYRLRLHDWMSRPELVPLYDRHGLYVFPSYFEGFGQTFLEAMARGLVVLATRVGGMAEVIRDGETGFLFRVGDAKGIRERAVSLLRERGLAERVGENARRSALSFTWESSARRLETFLSRVVAEGRIES